MRNKYNSIFRSKKSNYYKEFVVENSVSTKSFWQKLNPFLNPNKKQKISVSLISNIINNIHSAQDLVQAFSNYFASILNKFDFLNINVCIQFVQKFFEENSTLANLGPSNVFEFGLTNETIVLEQLKKMNPKSAPGSVNIESKIFKECAPQLAPALSELLYLCIENKTIPDEWKIAHITPIYKVKGQKSSLDNYRPISIITPISKIFEAILGVKMRAYLENNNLLHEDQNGFREGRSCHLALNTIVDFTKRNLDKKTTCCRHFS